MKRGIAYSAFKLFTIALFSKSTVWERTDLTVQAQTALTQSCNIFRGNLILCHHSWQHQVKDRAFCIHDASRQTEDWNYSSICFVRIVGNKHHRSRKHRCTVADNPCSGCHDGTRGTIVRIHAHASGTDDQVCACRDLPLDEAKKRVEAGEPFVIRQRIPHEGTTTFHDASFGDITVENKELEDQVLLKSDGLPTYNFANVVDDHLMGITHVVRGSEYLSSAPKYNLLYEAFGWEIPTYVHCSPVMRDAQHKMSKRHGDPSYEDLIREGYLTEAVLNYVALLGWSPKGENAEREFYTLSELAEIFDISGISKSPAVFDINKLRWMNAEYMKKLSPEAFFAKAEPVLKTVITNPAIDLKAVAALVQPRCEILSDLPERVDFIDRLPEYSTELYVHKKSKTTLENSLSSLREILPVLESLEVWTNEGLYEALVALAAKLELRNSVVLWPLRVAVSGKASTPGGATELCALLGKEESIARVKAGIALLEKS